VCRLGNVGAKSGQGRPPPSTAPRAVPCRSRPWLPWSRYRASRLFGDLFKIEVFDRFQRPSYLLPAAGCVRAVEHINQHACKPGDADFQPRAFGCCDTKTLKSLLQKRFWEGHPAKFVSPELSGPAGSTCELGERGTLNTLCRGTPAQCGRKARHLASSLMLAGTDRATPSPAFCRMARPHRARAEHARADLS